MQKKHSAVSSQRSANYAIARRKLEQSAKKQPRRLCGSDLPVATGPRTRDQHLCALAAKIDATHKALVTVATGIVNLKRKLRRQEEIYRTLAHNYGARTAEHTRQIIEASANNS